MATITEIAKDIRTHDLGLQAKRLTAAPHYHIEHGDGKIHLFLISRGLLLVTAVGNWPFNSSEGANGCEESLEIK